MVVENERSVFLMQVVLFFLLRQLSLLHLQVVFFILCEEAICIYFFVTGSCFSWWSSLRRITFITILLRSFSFNATAFLNFRTSKHSELNYKKKEQQDIAAPFFMCVSTVFGYNFFIFTFLNHTSSPCSCKANRPLVNVPKVGIDLNLLPATNCFQLSFHSVVLIIC